MLFLKSAFVAAIASLATVQASPVPQEPKEVAWQARHGMSSAVYKETSSKLSDQGYHLTYINGYTDDGSPRYAAIWEKGSTPAWTTTHNENQMEYNDSFQKLRGQGYHPVILNGYTVEGEARYESLWDKSEIGPWEQRTSLTAAGMQRAFEELKQKGYRIVHISGYAVGKEARYAGIWSKRQTGAWESRYGLNGAQYQDKTDEAIKKGFRPTQVHGYTVNGQNYYAGIWEKNDGRQWAVRFNMSSDKYQEEFDDLVGKGYKLDCVSGYPSGNSVKYAAIWTKK